MGLVYRSHDLRLDREVAVKVIESAGELGLDDALRQEASVAARLSHPGIVRVFDAGVDQGRAYVVMELVAGSTLAELIACRGPLPQDQVVQIGLELADALEHAHAAG